MNSPEKEKREQETYESFFAEPDQVKSLRPRPHKEVYQAAEPDQVKSLRPRPHKEVYQAAKHDQVKSLRPRPHKEVYQAAKHDLAIKFMNYLDENRPEGKMCLSNVECEDIDKAFKENDWVKIMRYVEKYSPSWKPSEEQMRVFFKATPVNLMPEELLIYQSLYNDIEKLM